MKNQVINKFDPDYKGINPSRGLKTQDSINGWKYIWKYDPTTVLKLLFGMVMSFLNFKLNHDVFTWYCVSTLVMAYTNFNNSSVEQLCDYLVKDEYDEKIKIIKDYAAANTNIPLLIWLSFSIYCLLKLIQIYI